MHLKASPLEIPEDKPFAHDVLGRSATAAALTQLVSNLTRPTVISIHSSWGTGKTTFINMWMQALKNDGYPCIYFNAWENDISDEKGVSSLFVRFMPFVYYSPLAQRHRHGSGTRRRRVRRRFTPTIGQ